MSVDTDVDRQGYRNRSGYRADWCPSTGDSLLLCISNKPAVAPEESTHTCRHTDIMVRKCKQDTSKHMHTLILISCVVSLWTWLINSGGPTSLRGTLCFIPYLITRKGHRSTKIFYVLFYDTTVVNTVSQPDNVPSDVFHVPVLTCSESDKQSFCL